MKFVILTTTPEDFTPKTLKEELEKEGHEALIINPDDCYIHIGKDPYISHNGHILSEADVCVPRFSDENAEYKLAIINHLENMGLYVVNSAKSVRLANNKLDSQIFFFKNGFKTPTSAMLTDENQLEYAMNSLDNKFPVIVKTLFGKGGVGVMKVESYPSLRGIVQLLLDRGVKFVIQEYIENDGAYRIMTIGGKYVCAMFRKIDTDKDFRTNSSQNSKAEKYEPSEREIAVCEQVSKLAGINFCAVDYMLDSEGEPIIFEFNSSPGFETLSEANSDLNIAQKLIEYCVQECNTLQNKADAVQQPGEGDAEIEQPTDDVNKAEEEEEEVAKKDDEEKPTPDEKEDTEKEPETIEKEPEVIGTITDVIIKGFNDEKPIPARVDTGAAYSSLHATDVNVENNTVSFRFENMKYKFNLNRMIKIKTSDSEEPEERPVIVVNIMINDKDVRDVEFTLTSRDHMKYDALLGRSALEKAGVLVDPSKEDKEDKEESKDEE